MHDPQTLVGSFPSYKTRIWLEERLHIKVKGIFDIWHHDPSGYDSETCGNSYNKLSHIGHWEFRFLPLRRLNHKLFQRCALCGGPSTKKNPVNHSFWDDLEYPFYYSKPEHFHETCMKKHSQQSRQLANTYRIEGYNRGYYDGRHELADGTGYHIPEDWKM